MAVYRHRKRKHPHCQCGVLHSLRLRHYVEQSHRTVSLYFTTVCFSLSLFSPSICISSLCTCFFDTQPGNSEMQRNVDACTCRYSVCFKLTTLSALISVRVVWRCWLCQDRTCCWDFWRCFTAWFNWTSVIGSAHLMTPVTYTVPPTLACKHPLWGSQGILHHIPSTHKCTECFSFKFQINLGRTETSTLIISQHLVHVHFFVEFSRVPCACVGFIWVLQLLSTVQRHAVRSTSDCTLPVSVNGRLHLYVSRSGSQFRLYPASRPMAAGISSCPLWPVTGKAVQIMDGWMENENFSPYKLFLRSFSSLPNGELKKLFKTVTGS